MMLLLGLARGATDCDGVDGRTFNNVVQKAAAGETIRVTDTACFTDNPGLINEKERITVVCGIATCSPPPLGVNGGSVTLSGFTFVESRDFSIDGPAYQAAVFAFQSDLTIQDSSFALTDLNPTTALVGYDSDLTLQGVRAVGTFVGGMSFVMVTTESASRSLTIGASTTDPTTFPSSFEGANLGAIRFLDTDGFPGSVSISDTRFAENWGEISDLYLQAEEVTLDNVTFTDSVAGTYAPVLAATSKLTATNLSFDTVTGASAATIWLYPYDGIPAVVRLDGVDIAAPSGDAVFRDDITAEQTFDWVNSSIELTAPIAITGAQASTDITIQGNRFAVDAGGALAFSNVDATVEHNEFCSLLGGMLSAYGLFEIVGGDLDVSTNIVHGLTMNGAVVATTVTGGGGGSAEDLVLHDNTFVDLSFKRLLGGTVGTLTYYNNLYSGPNGSPLAGFAVPKGILLEANLWDVTSADPLEFPAEWTETNSWAEPAGFLATYEAARGQCGSLPAIRTDSAAAGTGFPEDGTEDIGAVDIGAEGEWGGFRDTGEEDTGDPVDTGDTADSGDTDTDTATNDTDSGANSPCKEGDIPGNGVDENCNGSDAAISYGGGCGCGGGAPPAALAVGTVALSLRRRRR